MIATVPFEALMAYPERVSVGRRDGYPRLRHPTLRGRVVEPHTPKAKGPFQVIKPHVDVAFAEVAVFRDDVGARSRNEGNGQLSDPYVEVLDAATVAAHVQGIKVVDLDVLAAVISFAGPKLGIGLTREHIAGLDEGFPETELIVANTVRKICVIRRVRGVGLDHDLGFHPRFIRILLRVEPVVHEDQFAVGFCLVSQTIFRPGSRCGKCDLLSALTVQTIAGTKIAVEFKALHLFLELRDFDVRLPQQVVGWFGSELALVLGTHIAGPSGDNFLCCLFRCQLHRRDGSFICLCASFFFFLLFLFLDLLLEGGNALLEIASRSVVLLFQLLQLLLQILRLLCGCWKHSRKSHGHNPYNPYWARPSTIPLRSNTFGGGENADAAQSEPLGHNVHRHDRLLSLQNLNHSLSSQSLLPESDHRARLDANAHLAGPRIDQRFHYGCKFSRFRYLDCFIHCVHSAFFKAMAPPVAVFTPSVRPGPEFCPAANVALAVISSPGFVTSEPC